MLRCGCCWQTRTGAVVWVLCVEGRGGIVHDEAIWCTMVVNIMVVNIMVVNTHNGGQHI